MDARIEHERFKGSSYQLDWHDSHGLLVPPNQSGGVRSGFQRVAQARLPWYGGDQFCLLELWTIRAGGKLICDGVGRLPPRVGACSWRSDRLRLHYDCADHGLALGWFLHLECCTFQCGHHLCQRRRGGHSDGAGRLAQFVWCPHRRRVSGRHLAGGIAKRDDNHHRLLAQDWHGRPERRRPRGRAYASLCLCPLPERIEHAHGRRQGAGPLSGERRPGRPFAKPPQPPSAIAGADRAFPGT